MTDLTIFREYEPHELGRDGYPRVWHGGLVRHLFEGERGVEAHYVLDPPSALGVKHAVREQAGHRCERCGHPYVVGESGVYEVAGRPSEAPAAAVERFAEMADEAALEHDRKQKGQHWSSCDERCTHGHGERAPVRIRLHGKGDWSMLSTQWAGTVADAVRAGDEVEAAWRTLTVHHLNGRKHDLRWFNLAALCQRCHLSVQSRVQMERVYPFEHIEWFKPHAAGWYACCYNGENLTREEALERMDELLALERAA